MNNYFRLLGKCLTRSKFLNLQGVVANLLCTLYVIIILLCTAVLFLWYLPIYYYYYYIYVDYFIILLHKPRNTLENTYILKILHFSTITGDQKESHCALLIIMHRISSLRVIKIIF